MNDLNFYVLLEREAPSPLKENDLLPSDAFSLTVLDLGTLRIPSGQLEACEPLGEMGEGK